MRRIRVTLLGFLVVAAMLFKGSKALAQEAPAKEVTKIGYLSCNVASGWGFIIGSSRKLRCVYTPADKTKKVEQYNGSISKFGADIGYVQSGVILWTVVAPGMKITPRPGLLAGQYGGATAGATVGIGAGGNILVGGFDGSIALQPLSIEGNTGLNVAGGIAVMDFNLASMQRQATNQ